MVRRAPARCTLAASRQRPPGQLADLAPHACTQCAGRLGAAPGGSPQRRSFSARQPVAPRRHRGVALRRAHTRPRTRNQSWPGPRVATQQHGAGRPLDRQQRAVAPGLSGPRGGRQRGPCGGGAAPGPAAPPASRAGTVASAPRNRRGLSVQAGSRPGALPLGTQVHHRRQPRTPPAPEHARAVHRPGAAGRRPAQHRAGRSRLPGHGGTGCGARHRRDRLVAAGQAGQGGAHGRRRVALAVAHAAGPAESAQRVCLWFIC